MKLVIFFLLFLLCFTSNGLLSQPSRIDSLTNTLPGSTGRERFSILSELSKMTAYSDPKRFKGYAEEALALAQELNDPLLLVNALNTMAIYYYNTGKSREALTYLLQSIDIMQAAYEKDTTNLELLNRIAIASNNASNVYKGMGKPAKALDAILKAIRSLDILLAAKPQDSHSLNFYVSCLNNTGLLYIDMKEFSKAEEILNEALTVSREINYKKGIAMSLNNIGLIFIEQEQYGHALTFYEEALLINKTLDDSISIAGTYNNIGLIHEKTGSYRKAMNFYKRSLLITERLQYIFGVANTCNNIGKVYTALRQYDSARIYLDRGLTTAQASDLLDLQKESYRNLAILEEESRNYQQALSAYKAFSHVKDSIFNIEKSKQIAEMQAKYETDKKEKENEILRIDISLRRKTQQLLVVAVSALVLVIILLVILVRYNRRMLKQKSIVFQQKQQMHVLEMEKKEVERKHFEDQVFAEQEINRLQKIKLDEQNRKLATSAIQVTVKNQILLSILHELEQAENGMVEDSASRLKSIGQTVRNNLNFDRDWEQFKMHFEEVHPGFFSRLKESHPDLTSGEQKICAYYLINLGTNEIAQLLNVTIAAVQKSRHRLRKKLGLDSDTDMAEFMLRF